VGHAVGDRRHDDGDRVGQSGGFLESAGDEVHRDPDGATDQGVTAAVQQELSDVDPAGAGGDGQGRRGDEHRRQPVMANDEHLDGELQRGQDDGQPPPLRVPPQDPRGEDQTHPRPDESVGTPLQGPAAVGTLVQDEHRGGDRPIRVADAERHRGGSGQRSGDRDANHDVPDV
jgi:hypothetical protein